MSHPLRPLALPVAGTDTVATRASAIPVVEQGAPVFAGIVITRMTGRTCGAIGTMRKARNVLVIAPVTRNAGDTRIMGAWITDIVRMPVGARRCPRGCRMTVITLGRGDKVA